MILNNSPYSWSGKDITSEIDVYEYTAVRDSLIWVRVQVGSPDGQLNSSGAATLRVRLTRKFLANRYHMQLKELDTTTYPANGMCRVSFHFEAPVVLMKDEVLVIRVYSSNASDSDVAGYVYIADHHARSYASNDIPEVDAVQTNGEAFMTQAEAQQACQSTLENNYLHLVADGNGRVDVAKWIGSGSDAERFVKAAKMLVNKAIQNKVTGAIVYYDGDGQTVILTHTPNDGESEITRTPS